MGDGVMEGSGKNGGRYLVEEKVAMFSPMRNLRE